MKLASQILILAIFFAPLSGGAGVWEFMSKSTYHLFYESCPSQDNSKETNPICSAKDPYQSIRKQNQDIGQNIYLAELAKERAETDQCALDYATKLNKDSKDFEIYANDFQEKVEMLAAEMVQNIRLSKQAIDKKGNPSELKSIQEAFRKSSSSIASIENSIQLGDQPAINKLITQLVQEMTNEATTQRALTSKNAVPAKSLDPQKLRARLKAALPKTQSNLSTDIAVLEKGVKTNGQSLDRTTRESLAQDRDLVERFMQKDPQKASSYQWAACEVNATYGKGAELRDQALFIGSIGATAASMGVGLAARGSIAVAAATTPARMAAARGAILLRSSRIIGSAAMGLDGIGALKQVDSCPDDHAANKVTSHSKENRCADYKIESIETNNCYLGAALSALGFAASSEKARNFVAKLVNIPALQAKKPMEELLGRKISVEQEAAIQRAHLVGSGEIGADGVNKASVGNYTKEQIEAKARILHDAGFKPEETRLLMEHKYVGFDYSRQAYERGSSSRAHARARLDPKGAENEAMKEFREAYQKGKFDGEENMISYKVPGTSWRTLVRVDTINPDGSLRVVDKLGNVQHLTIQELETARVSTSPKEINEFMEWTKNRNAGTFGDSPIKDAATAEFRDRFSRSNFETPSADTPFPEIISYVDESGQRVAARVDEIAGNYIFVRDQWGMSRRLKTKEAQSARMASQNSARAFMEEETGPNYGFYRHQAEQARARGDEAKAQAAEARARAERNAYERGEGNPFGPRGADQYSNGQYGGSSRETGDAGQKARAEREAKQQAEAKAHNEKESAQRRELAENEARARANPDRNKIDLDRDADQIREISNAQIRSLDDVKRTLKMDRNATSDEVKKQIRRLSSKYHPDQNQDLSHISTPVIKNLNRMRDFLD